MQERHQLPASVFNYSSVTSSETGMVNAEPAIRLKVGKVVLLLAGFVSLAVEILSR